MSQLSDRLSHYWSKIQVELGSTYVIFVPPFQAREALMRDFNSQEGCSKPILRMKITPEGLSLLEWGHKNDIRRAWEKH
jgi:hypothetical protein